MDKGGTVGVTDRGIGEDLQEPTICNRHFEGCKFWIEDACTHVALTCKMYMYMYMYMYL